MNNLFLKKIIKNFNISLKQYDNYSASKYWKKSINKKKKLFKISNLNNFRNNGLSNNIDDFYINEDKSKKLFENLKNYCGEKFLTSTIESILKQTFVDFEIIISNNASTDKTSDICKKFINQIQ